MSCIRASFAEGFLALIAVNLRRAVLALSAAGVSLRNLLHALNDGARRVRRDTRLAAHCSAKLRLAKPLCARSIYSSVAPAWLFASGRLRDGRRQHHWGRVVREIARCLNSRACKSTCQASRRRRERAEALQVRRRGRVDLRDGVACLALHDVCPTLLQGLCSALQAKVMFAHQQKGCTFQGTATPRADFVHRASSATCRGSQGHQAGQPSLAIAFSLRHRCKGSRHCA